MQRGTITILLILGVAIVAATASVVYHYANQRYAQDFWGAPTAALIDKAPQAEVITLAPAEPGLSLGSDSDDEPAEEPAPEEKPADQKSTDEAPAEAAPETPAIKALEFNGLAWVVSGSKDAAGARGINNLRRALVLDTTYNWSELPSTEDPAWQYGLAVNDGQNWATVLFDFKARLVGLAGGRRTAVLNPEASTEFEKFFEEQFAPGQ